MKHLIYICILVCGLSFSACNDYLDIVPKGNKIPTTLADYEALLRDEYTIGQTSISNALYLLNDYYVTVSNLNSPTLTRANYMWDETADRILLNNADESTYYQLYAAISSCNLLIENVPSATEATDAQRAEVIAYAKVIRSLNFSKHYQDVISGQIGLDNLIYFLTLIFPALWINVVALNYKKQ